MRAGTTRVAGLLGGEDVPRETLAARGRIRRGFRPLLGPEDERIVRAKIIIPSYIGCFPQTWNAVFHVEQSLLGAATDPALYCPVPIIRLNQAAVSAVLDSTIHADMAGQSPALAVGDGP